MKRVLAVATLALVVAAFFAFDLGSYLTLDGLRAAQARIDAAREAAPLLVAGTFFVAYVAVAALSLPGAAIMTLAGGAFFGFASGLVLVSFASSIGATLAFLVARFLLRDAVQARFGARLRAVDEGIAKDGGFYLFTVRLVPVFPFFVVNLLMGLTRIRTWTFYWVSQLGMLAGTAVYVNAGTRLAELDSLSGILSPALLGSFALLGVFPLAAKWLVATVRRRRVYARWRRPARYDTNLVVIGAGAAGLVASYIAAAVKAKVTLVESHRMGGDCLNFGCVPSKALIKSARLAHAMRHAGDYGLRNADPGVDFPRVMARVREVIRHVEPHDSEERYTSLGVDVVRGHARIVDPWTVEIADGDAAPRRVTTRSIVIAAGARPFVPPLPGIEDVGYVTSDTLWDRFATLERAPGRLVILGGGPIGCELAQAFARLGSHVIQVERAARLMGREDEDVSTVATHALERDGVEVLSGHEAVRCERDGERRFLVVRRGDAERRIEFDELLCAVGRVARLEGYGLEALGIPTDRTVVVDEYVQTIYPNIYAAGDVAGPYQFTHFAAHQAWYAAVNALFGHLKRTKADYSIVPRSTFVDPEIARVGLNEQEAREQGVEVEVTRFGIDDLDRAIADGVAHGFVKVLTAKGKDRIVGVTIVGEHAGDLLAEMVLAMKHGLGLNKVLGTIHSYPTLAEANKYAAGEWKRAHAPQGVLRWLERYHAWRRG